MKARQKRYKELARREERLKQLDIVSAKLQMKRHLSAVRSRSCATFNQRCIVQYTYSVEILAGNMGQKFSMIINEISLILVIALQSVKGER